jgi:ParB family transcriptional regulator, chromosome partitioning protein
MRICLFQGFMKDAITLLYKYSNELNGSVEDINMLDISSPKYQLRKTMSNVEELAESIKKFGLLQPIVVRTNNSDNFEIVAGNRRYNACRRLGRKKIVCHVVELDDKTAYEVSIIENVQRHTLNPIEEGLAFRKYVKEFGWGGVSELGQKMSKSTSYICKRIKLVELPRDVKELISKSEINVSIAEELLPISNKNTQSKLTELIQEKNLSSRMVRKLVKGVGTKNMDKDPFYDFAGRGDSEIIYRSFDKAIIALRISIKKLAVIIENIDDKWMFYDILMQHKHMLHNQIDLLIKEKRKYKKHSLLLLSFL